MYRQIELEAEGPIPEIRLDDEEEGVAVVVRHRGRPVAFWLEAVPSRMLSAKELGARVLREAGAQLLRNELDDALPLPEHTTRPSVTIAVCTRDRPERLGRCLDGLLNLEVPPGVFRPKLLVVDNAPPNSATEMVVSRYPEVRYTVEPVPGLNCARNRALDSATTGWIAFVDDDVVVDRTWLTGIVRALRNHPDARAITGLVLPFTLEAKAQVLFERAGGFRRGCKSRRYTFWSASEAGYPAGAGVFGAGANMAFEVETLRQLGGFDPALDTGPPLPGGGDLDIFYRIVRNRFVLVYEPSVLVYHEHRREMKALRKQYYTWGLGFGAYVRKHQAQDAEMRKRFRCLIRWWFEYQARSVVGTWIGRHPVPTTLVLAEWVGGLVGLLGEYTRSQKRMAARRSAVGSGS